MVFAKQSLNHRLSLNLMSLNRDCTVLNQVVNRQAHSTNGDDEQAGCSTWNFITISLLSRMFWHFLTLGGWKINEPQHYDIAETNINKYVGSHSIYIRTVRTQLLFNLGTFDSFLAGLDRNRVYCACCSAKMAQKPVYYSREELTVLIYIVQAAQPSCEPAKFL